MIFLTFRSTKDHSLKTPSGDSYLTPFASSYELNSWPEKKVTAEEILLLISRRCYAFLSLSLREIVEIEEIERGVNYAFLYLPLIVDC